MAKRKRSHAPDEPKYDVGVGPTLALLRDGAEGGSGSNKDGVDGDDGGGWTVVGPSRKRRKEHDGASTNVPRSAPTPPTAVSPAPSTSSTPMTREERRKERKLHRHYPAIEHSHHARLSSHVKLADLQALVLYLLADGPAPQWVSVCSRASIQQVVMLMVPGLELAMFTGDVALEDVSSPAASGEAPDGTQGDVLTKTTGPATQQCLKISHNDFYPAALKSDKLPDALKPLAQMFDHVWPIKAPGEHRNQQYQRLHSPIHTVLTSQIPKSAEDKQLKRSGKHKGPMPQNAHHWENKRTPITEYVATLAEQQDHEYVLHPAMFTTPEAKAAAFERRKLDKQTAEDGWVDTNVDSIEVGDMPDADYEQGSITAGRRVISVDCEMCMSTNNEHVLTRISLLDWDGGVVLDKLVKPDVPIKDYLTQWSGITADMLENVTTNLRDIQTELLTLLTPRTILVGHSLNSDLVALKLTHPFLIDTAILYPHPRGLPIRHGLKWLAQKFLKREVQKGTSGHDSVEDAKTCLDLVKQKCEKGPGWGLGDTNAESIFKRISRSSPPNATGTPRYGAVVDWGDPSRGHGGQAHVSKGCRSDAQIVETIGRVVSGQETSKEGSPTKVDFVWSRLRELEIARGWWDEAKTADVEAIRLEALDSMNLRGEDSDSSVEAKGSALGSIVKTTVDRIVDIYDSLPRCTAFVVYSGTGDPRNVRRLHAMQKQYRHEYATKNWDNLSVKWTDTEVQALSQACQKARNGIGFVVVK